MNYKHAQPILPNLWIVPNFFDNFDEIRKAYRNPKQPWNTEYNDRLLTPWGSNPVLENVLEKSLPPLAELTQTGVDRQVCYTSLDLGGSQIMMHRLHPDIKCFVQVCMADVEDVILNSCFCVDEQINQNHPVDYADISDFDANKIIEIEYKPNTAWILLNSPRLFFGTKNPVPKNNVRETLNLHFSDILKTTT